jgi:SAM-dependent methyltransferase
VTDRPEYLLTGGQAELERLRLQATVWEPDADALFDGIPVLPNWNCVDLGCGAMGVLRGLSARTLSGGHVLGVDSDRKLLASAQSFAKENALANVTLQEADLFENDLPPESFDLVHLRFMLAPIGRENEILAAALRLTRPGGVIALQEPDAACWSSLPPDTGFDRLKNVILEAFSRGGGDFNAGRRTTALLRAAGVRDVRVRAALHVMSDRHPYMRLPCQFAESLRGRIVELGIASAQELDDLVASVERMVAEPGRSILTFAVIQTWGQKGEKA